MDGINRFNVDESSCRVPDHMRTLTHAEALRIHREGLPLFGMKKATGQIEQINNYPWGVIENAWHCNELEFLGVKYELKTGPVNPVNASTQLRLYEMVKNSDLASELQLSGDIHKLYKLIDHEADWSIEIPYSHQGQSMDNIEAMDWFIEEYGLDEYIIDDSDTSICISAPEDHRVISIEVCGNGTEFEHLFSLTGLPKTPETLEKDIEILRKRQEETEKLIVQKYILREHRILFPEKED